MTAQVVVVGGGLAGLLTASQLTAGGVDDVVVFEASDQAGGAARTVARNGYSLEPGVGSFMLPHPDLSEIIERLGVPVTPAAALDRHVWTGRRLVTLPTSPAILATRLLPTTAKLRALAEPLVGEPAADDDESLDRLLRRRFGHEAGRMLAWLAATGVYAGDPRRLSAQAAFPLLASLIETHGSLVGGALSRLRSRPPIRPSTHVPTANMAALADAAAAALGERFHPRHPVSSVRRSGEGWTVEGANRVQAAHVVLACDARTVAALVGPGLLADLLRPAAAAPVAVVGLGGASPAPLPDGFGILTGPDTGTHTRGVLLESSYAPHRAPAGHWLLKVIAGGAGRGGIVAADDDHLVATVGAEVARIVGTDLEASFTHVVRHRPGIPQYEVGHARWLAAVEAATPPGLHLTGWAYRGVGLASLATDATRLAHALGGVPRTQGSQLPQR